MAKKSPTPAEQVDTEITHLADLELSLRARGELPFSEAVKRARRELELIRLADLELSLRARGERPFSEAVKRARRELELELIR